MKQPNIIFFFSDQHNFRKMGYAGDEYIKTPFFDEYANKGVIFENCYCNSPLCVPSRMSMMTGRMPMKTGVYTNTQELPSVQATFAHSLTNAGYETVLSGRMHFIGMDQHRGFEKRLVGDITNEMPVGDKDIWGYLKSTPGQVRDGIIKSGAGHSAVMEYDNAVIEGSCKFLEERKDKRPLFFLVGTYGPHCPFVADEKWFAYYDAVLPEVDVLLEKYKLSEHPAMAYFRTSRNIENLPKDKVRSAIVAYYALISSTDENFGRIMETAKRTLDMDNTIVIYSSDHGESIGEHGLFWKSSMDEGAVHVPFFVYGPKLLRSQVSLKGVVSLLDISKTILELADAEELPSMDGLSLVPYLKAEKELPNREVISVFADWFMCETPVGMIRSGDFKLIHHAKYKTLELFDLKNDPLENNDLGSDDNYKEFRNKLMKKLEEIWNPEKVEIELQQAKKKHLENKASYQIIDKWIKTTGKTPMPNWECDKLNNYII